VAVAVGIDVAKETHWVEIKVAETGRVLSSHPVSNTPPAIGELIEAIRAAEVEHGPARVGLDLLGGVATLLEAMLLDAGLRVLHVPGVTVNEARRGTVGGEQKSDPKDARVIADQLRMHDDFRELAEMREEDVELRLLVGRRGDIVADQTRRAARLRELLASIHPQLEATVDVTSKTGLWLLTRYVTPAEIRTAGQRRLATHLSKLKNVKNTIITTITENALEAARAQRISVPGEAVAAELIRGLAAEMLAARDQLALIDKHIAGVLERHPDAALIRSLPGMGATLTAEFLAITGGIDRYPNGDHLAAAAGIAPVRRQSGKVSFMRRARAGDKALKRVFFQSAFIAVGCDPTSKAYYARKRAQGKNHQQAVIALARRRVNVLHAIMRTRQPYDHRNRPAA
jgi:transposase